MKTRYKVQGTRCMVKSGRAGHGLETCHERASIAISLYETKRMPHAEPQGSRGFEKHGSFLPARHTLRSLGP